MSTRGSKSSSVEAKLQQLGLILLQALKTPEAVKLSFLVKGLRDGELNPWFSAAVSGD